MKIINRITAVLLVAVIALILPGCAGFNSNKKINGDVEKNITYPLTLKDSFNREITLEKEPARVVSLAPNITEIIFALEKSDKLVGRTDYCDYPEEAKKISSVGSLLEPNIERIAELKPDLVIASTHFKKEVLQKLEEIGIQVAVFYGEDNFEGTYENIKNISVILNAVDKGNEIVSAMKEKVANIVEKVKDKEKPLVYYVVEYGKYGDFTAGKDTFIGTLIETAGGKNAADDVKGWKYSLERLIEKNPNLIICPQRDNSKEGIKAANGYKELKAVKDNKVYAINSDLLDRQGPRIADGLMELAKIIHPEIFK